MKKNLLLVLSFLSILVVSFGGFATEASAAECKATLTQTAVAKECADIAEPLKGKLLAFVTVLSSLVVVFAVGMIIYGGFKYITSQGDPKQAESAKQQIWLSGVGLFITIAAFTILKLFVQASGGTL